MHLSLGGVYFPPSQALVLRIPIQSAQQGKAHPLQGRDWVLRKLVVAVGGQRAVGAAGTGTGTGVSLEVLPSAPLRWTPRWKLWGQGHGQSIPISAPTFEGRLQDGGWFGCQEELLGVAAEGPALLRRDDELPGEACAVADVVVLIVLGQTQHVLGQQLGLGDERAAAVVREGGTREVSEPHSEPTPTPPHRATLPS